MFKYEGINNDYINIWQLTISNISNNV